MPLAHLSHPHRPPSALATPHRKALITQSRQHTLAPLHVEQHLQMPLRKVPPPGLVTIGQTRKDLADEDDPQPVATVRHLRYGCEFSQ